eukprot:771395-Karenia_brevis.AAC.1
MQQHNGQFGQRVHLDPTTTDGRALMHSNEDGWMHSCTSKVGWGVPMSGKKWGRPPRPHSDAEYDEDDRGHHSEGQEMMGLEGEPGVQPQVQTQP